MTLLHRIAYSNGKPERTVVALRLITERLQRELSQHSAPSATLLGGQGLSRRLHRVKAKKKRA